MQIWKISLNWTQSNLKVDHEYRVYKDGELITATKKLSFEDFTTAGKFYCYEIKVVDKYDTEGPSSNSECKKILVNYPRKLQVAGDVKRVIFSFKKRIGAVAYNIYTVDKETDTLVFLKNKKYSVRTQRFRV